MSDTDNSSQGNQTLEALAGTDHAGWRLDRFLAAALPQFTRSRLQQLLADGAVTRDKATVRDPNTRVKPDDAFILIVPPAAAALPLGQDIPLTVVHEDRDLIVIEKPAASHWL